MKHDSPRSFRQRRLSFCTPSRVATACALAFCAPLATAQSDAQQLDTVVVTGIRKSLESSLNLKRKAGGLVDGIVAEDIGKFPDTNLAESMQRIAGVSIDRAQSGEGSKVTVRGVGPDFNMVLLNGRQMPTSVIGFELAGANGSRAFDFANLSSDAIAALEVSKTSRASTPTGGIGATINVRTGRPLDTKVRVLSFGAKLNLDDSNKRLPSNLKGDSVTPDLSGIYSETFADGTFGVAISASYSKRHSGANRANTPGGWRVIGSSGDWGALPARPATGADPITNRPSGLYAVPVDMRYGSTGIQRERINGQLTLQFAPSKDLKFTLDHTLANNEYHARQAELSNWFSYSYGPTSFTTGNAMPSPIFHTAVWDGTHDLTANAGVYSALTKLNSTGFNAEWKVSSDLKLDFDVHHSTSKTTPNSPFGSYSVISVGMFGQGNALAYYDQATPLVSLPGTTWDKTKQAVTGSQFNNNLSDQTIDQFQTAATYRLNADSKLNAGLGFTKLKNRAASVNAQNGDWGGVGTPTDYANLQVDAISLPGLLNRMPGSGDARLHPHFYLHNFETARALAVQAAMRPAAAGFKGLTKEQAEAYFMAKTDYSNGNDWRLKESSTNAYVQWDQAFDAAGLPMNLAMGLRYERTKVDSASQVVSRTASSWNSLNEIELAAGPVTFGSGTGKYSHVLPSIDWDAEISPDFKVRASYGHNIGRPGFGQLLGGVNVINPANTGFGQGTTGNPALKPLLSKNLDLSGEWYYARSSYLAASAFYKKVSNFVGESTVRRTFAGLTTPVGGAYYRAALVACGNVADAKCLRNFIFNTYDGQPGVTRTGVNAAGEIQGRITGLPGDPAMPFDITTPSNEAGDNIKGLELNVQHMFGSSGFGVAANYTKVKTGLKFDNSSNAVQSALVGVSDSANLVLFYENDALSARAAYNWRDDFLAGKVDGSGQNNPVYTEAYGQVDLTVSYRLNKNLTLQADILNATDEIIRQHGRTKEQVILVSQTGRRYLVGMRYRF